MSGGTPMSNFLRFIELFTLGTWLGGILYLSFVVAPGAFSVLGSRDQAGAFVGFALGRLHVIGIALGVLYLASAGLRPLWASGTGKAAMLAVVLMIVITACSQFGVTQRMRALRTQMGSVDATPASDPLRQRFDRLHKLSVRLEGVVMVAGLVALYLAVCRTGS
jgi:uncharacterized membrane protein